MLEERAELVVGAEGQEGALVGGEQERHGQVVAVGVALAEAVLPDGVEDAADAHRRLDHRRHELLHVRQLRVALALQVRRRHAEFTLRDRQRHLAAWRTNFRLVLCRQLFGMFF